MMNEHNKETNDFTNKSMDFFFQNKWIVLIAIITLAGAISLQLFNVKDNTGQTNVLLSTTNKKIEKTNKILMKSLPRCTPPCVRDDDTLKCVGPASCDD
jgi:hypothetical protein